VITAACVGAAIGGLIIWALQTYVFNGGDVPGALIPVIDIAAPLLGALVFGWLGQGHAESSPGPPSSPGG